MSEPINAPKPVPDNKLSDVTGGRRKLEPDEPSIDNYCRCCLKYVKTGVARCPVCGSILACKGEDYD